MTAKEIQKRNEKAQQLRVLQTDDGSFYVESAEQKIMYRVIFTDTDQSCVCGDFTRNSKNDPGFKCKHLLAVISAVQSGSVENAAFIEKQKPRLDERFITTIQGREFVLYAGLLDMAHMKGIRRISVEAMQYPTKENGMEAICKASVESKLGEEFVEWGDASPGNVNKMIASHILRMAATRAKARALRDYVNIGITCIEEIGNLDDVLPKTGFQKPSRKKAPVKAQPAKKEAPAAQNNNPPVSVKSDDQKTQKAAPEEATTPQDAPVLMSDAQKRAILNLSRRRGISVESLEQMVQDTYHVNLDNLTTADASAFIRQLQQAA
ncbi:SWIM zinc finger family protein [Desulfosudis oleivorans]|uniref:Zinc finger SWIM domain protein n=1 Tax=Desulfosudis oleivorans (strain DSM 6200 / JCM 39069 / Hxd3) TaxID=96561 RepID=A8ZYK0_DESOH|nr:SWIM zinc finger family protein [Desulfosudis oleivorans]ABW68725.1 zinc finger SWIM domain protein [Desulfosudis oleivorans Hxd3]